MGRVARRLYGNGSQVQPVWQFTRDNHRINFIGYQVPDIGKEVHQSHPINR